MISAMKLLSCLSVLLKKNIMYDNFKKSRQKWKTYDNILRLRVITPKSRQTYWPKWRAGRSQFFKLDISNMRVAKFI